MACSMEPPATLPAGVALKGLGRCWTYLPVGGPYPQRPLDQRHPARPAPAPARLGRQAIARAGRRPMGAYEHEGLRADRHGRVAFVTLDHPPLNLFDAVLIGSLGNL